MTPPKPYQGERVRRALEAGWSPVGDESEGHDDVVRMGEAVGRLREALRVVR